MTKKKKKRIEPDSIIDLFPVEEEEERDLSWMIDGVIVSANTNNKKGKKNETDK
jgi:hypothetical protein